MESSSEQDINVENKINYLTKLGYTITNVEFCHREDSNHGDITFVPLGNRILAHKEHDKIQKMYDQSTIPKDKLVENVFSNEYTQESYNLVKQSVIQSILGMLGASNIFFLKKQAFLHEKNNCS